MKFHPMCDQQLMSAHNGTHGTSRSFLLLIHHLAVVHAGWNVHPSLSPSLETRGESHSIPQLSSFRIEGFYPLVTSIALENGPFKGD